MLPAALRCWMAKSLLWIGLAHASTRTKIDGEKETRIRTRTGLEDKVAAERGSRDVASVHAAEVRGDGR